MLSGRVDANKDKLSLLELSFDVSMTLCTTKKDWTMLIQALLY